MVASSLVCAKKEQRMYSDFRDSKVCQELQPIEDLAQYGISTLPQRWIHKWLKMFKNGRASVKHEEAEQQFSKEFLIHV